MDGEVDEGCAVWREMMWSVGGRVEEGIEGFSRSDVDIFTALFENEIP